MHRNCERERRAHALLALHPDPAAVEFHKLSAQGEPEPCALDLLRGCPHLAELLEDLLLIFRGYADSGVADGDLNDSILRDCADVDAPTFWSELDGVRQQVQDDLADLAFIRLNLAQPVIAIRVKGD